MAGNIPFFDMFAELQLSGELRLKLSGAEITGAVIDQGKMTISLDLTARTPMTEEDTRALETLIRGVYGFSQVQIHLTAPAAPRAAAPAEASPAPTSGKDKQGAACPRCCWASPSRAAPTPCGS